MQSPATDLIVRGHDRVACDLPAAISIASGSSGIRLSRSALGAGGMLQARAVDLSSGGIGFSSHVYLPPSCEIRVSMNVPDAQGQPRAFTVTLYVRRAAMLDRKPTYYIGAGFEGEDPQRAAIVEQAMAVLLSSGKASRGDAARA